MPEFRSSREARVFLTLLWFKINIKYFRRQQRWIISPLQLGSALVFLEIPIKVFIRLSHSNSNCQAQRYKFNISICPENQAICQCNLTLACNQRMLRIHFLPSLRLQATKTAGSSSPATRSARPMLNKCFYVKLAVISRQSSPTRHHIKLAPDPLNSALSLVLLFYCAAQLTPQLRWASFRHLQLVRKYCSRSW